MWFVVFLQCSEIESDCFEVFPISVRKSTNIAFFKCSSLLACKASRVQLSICFPISPSRIHLTSSLYLCPADCFQDILFEQAGNSHWKELAFLPTYQDWLLRSHPIFDRKVGINITAPCTLESKNKFGSKCDAFGADVSSRMYVYSPYTICLRNWLTQACATKGFAYAGLLWHDSFNSHQGRLWKMLMLPGCMKVLHLMWIRPMKCWLAMLNVSSAIVSHALEQINAAWTGVICLSASSKLSASCLHGYSVSIRKIQGFFSGRRYSQQPRLSRP